MNCPYCSQEMKEIGEGRYTTQGLVRRFLCGKCAIIMQLEPVQ